MITHAILLNLLLRSGPLDVPLAPQKTEVWCWAATTEMLQRFYSDDVSPESQCQLATKYYGKGKNAFDCRCVERADGTTEIQNEACTRKGAKEPLDFSDFQLHAVPAGKHYLSPTDLACEINEHDRPVAFSWIWSGGARHMMVAIDALPHGKPARFVMVRNPDPRHDGATCLFTYSRFVGNEDEGDNSGPFYNHGIDYIQILPAGAKADACPLTDKKSAERAADMLDRQSLGVSTGGDRTQASSLLLRALASTEGRSFLDVLGPEGREAMGLLDLPSAPAVPEVGVPTEERILDLVPGDRPPANPPDLKRLHSWLTYPLIDSHERPAGTITLQRQGSIWRAGKLCYGLAELAAVDQRHKVAQGIGKQDSDVEMLFVPLLGARYLTYELEKQKGETTQTCAVPVGLGDASDPKWESTRNNPCGEAPGLERAIPFETLWSSLRQRAARQQPP
jgi:hypothetical protein